MFDRQENLQRYLAKTGVADSDEWLNRLTDSALRAIWRMPDVVELCPWGEPVGTAALEVAIDRIGQDALGLIILESPIYHDPYNIALSFSLPVRHERALGVYHYLAPAVLTTSSIGGRQWYTRISDTAKRQGLRKVTIPGPVVTHGPVPGMWVCLAPGRLYDGLVAGERLLTGRGLEFVPRSVHWLTGPANETYALVVEFRAPWIDYALYSFRQYQDMAARGVLMPGRVGALIYGDISLQDTEAEMVNCYVEATADLLRGPVFSEVLECLESWVQQAGAARIYGDSRTFSPESLYAVARETLQQAGYATTNEGFSKDLTAQGGRA